MASVTVTGMAELWEASEQLRNRLRETNCLIARPPGHAWCDANRPNCTANDEVLLPVLKRMADDERKLPYLDPLRQEVAALGHRMSLSFSEKEVYTMSVEVKKLCSFVKRRALRKEVTKDRND